MPIDAFAGALLADVKVLPPKGANTSIYLDLNHFSRQTAWAHGFMHAYALWLGPVLLVGVFLAAGAVLWWRRDTHGLGLLGLGGIGAIVAIGLNQLVGHAARELRPYDTFHHVLVLVPKANDYAFPSDHAVAAGALFTAILLVLGRRAPRPSAAVGASAPDGSTGDGATGRAGPALVWLAAANVVLGLFLAFARVYVGAHYPGDVVAGLLLGIVVVVLASLARPLVYRLADLVERTPVAVLLRRPLSTVAAPVATGGGDAPGTTERVR